MSVWEALVRYTLVRLASRTISPEQAERELTGLLRAYSVKIERAAR